MHFSMFPFYAILRLEAAPTIRVQMNSAMPSRSNNTKQPRSRPIAHQLASTLTGNFFTYFLTFYQFFCHPISAGNEIFYPCQTKRAIRLTHGPAFAATTASLMGIILYLLQERNSSSTPFDDYIWLLSLISLAVALALYTYIIVGNSLPFGSLVNYFCYYVSCIFVLSALAILSYPDFAEMWYQAAYGLVNQSNDSTLWQSLMMWGVTLIFLLYANMLGYILCVHPIITFRQVGKISAARLLILYGLLWMLVLPTIVVTFFVFYLVPSLHSLRGITD